MSIRGADGALRFIDDQKKVNVMLTRAQEMFIFIGDVSGMGAASDMWKGIHTQAIRYNLISEVSMPRPFVRQVLSLTT